MQHETYDNPCLKIEETTLTFEKIYKKEYIPTQYIDDIKKANCLIIPSENFRNEKDILFPETTRDFYNYIRENSGDDILFDIAVSDEKFQMIELHSAVITIATIVVKYAVLPIVTSMIAAFLYDLVKKYHRKNEETSAEVNIITEETKTKKSKKITYKGPVSGIKDALDSAAKELFTDEK